MLANLLPGLREIRAPVISGYLWLAFFFLALHSDLPTRANAGAALRPLFELGDRLSVLGIATVASVAAYLVGSAMQEVIKLVGRLVSPRKPLYGEAGTHTTIVGRRSLATSVDVRVQGIVRRLFHVALSPGERGIDHAPRAGDVIGELPLVRTMMLGEHPELVGELDRLQAEADLRITVSIPLAALALFLAGEASSGWLFALIPAGLLLLQGFQRQREAGDFLARVLHIGRTDPPVLRMFEISVDAALERTELEWKLEGEVAGGDGMAAFRHGNLQASAGEYERAIVSLELAVDRGVVQAYAEIGAAQEELSDPAKAERAYRDGAERGDWKARDRLARLLSRLERNEEALAAEQRDEDAEAAPASVQVPRTRSRIVDYKKRIEGGEAKAAINLGLLYKGQEEWEEAIGAFRRATELDATDAQAWVQLGLAQNEHLDHAAARLALERGLEIQERNLGPNHLRRRLDAELARRFPAGARRVRAGARAARRRDRDQGKGASVRRPEHRCKPVRPRQCPEIPRRSSGGEKAAGASAGDPGKTLRPKLNRVGADDVQSGQHAAGPRGG